MFETHTPSPEFIYIEQEEKYLKTLDDYKNGNLKFNSVIISYLMILESNYEFAEIRVMYENEIDQREDDFNFWLTTPDYKIIKERVNLFMSQEEKQKHVYAAKYKRFRFW